MAAAAAAEAVALRALPESGIRLGSPSLRRIPAEPSPALARRGSLQPGKPTERGVAGRAEHGSAVRRAPGTQHGAPVPRPLRATPS